MKKKRIVILGGGMASLVTAFELTRTPELRRRFDITVLTHGHRLGGKGASGVNAAAHHRIEEHGLHILYGFYENVFRVLRECYDELDRPPDAPLATWRDAVAPQHLIVLPEREGKDVEFWSLFAPPNDEVPGDGTALDDPYRYVTRILDWSATLLRTFAGVRPDDYPRTWSGELAEALEAPGTALLRKAVRKLVTSRDETGELSVLPLVQAAVRLATALTPDSAEDRRSLLWLIQRTLDWLWSRTRLNKERKRLRIFLDLGLTIARGVLADELTTSQQRWFDIDDEDFKAWLSRHGARHDTIQSPLVRGLYHAAFAVHEPLGAGTILHALLRMVSTYKGAILYRMQAGMGDTVFAPLYQVLQGRGVRFEFFSAVQRLELSADKRRVERIVVDRQATMKSGAYEPLIDVDGLPCWPSEPRFEQLVEGEAIRGGGHNLESFWNQWPAASRDTLEAGRHFDSVVLGISLGALPYVCRELVDDAHNPRFRAMVERVRTTQTQAAQLWFDRDLNELGWPAESGEHPPILIPFDQPFDTCSDMTYLLAHERWPEHAAPRHLSYLCAPLEDDEVPPGPEDHDYPVRQKARVREHLSLWLEHHASALWPELDGPRGFAWERLVDPQGRSGAARLDAQYHCAVVHPSDRYNLSVPGSVRCRLRAGESGYTNLVLAGDWTKTALSIGCLEAATMSAFAAARVIDRDCRKAYGDWLPEESSRVSEVRELAPGLPPYLSQGQLIAPPPISMRSSCSMFMLEASLPKLTALCDRYLNLRGSPTHYRPLGPHVTLYCSAQDRHGPIEDPIGVCPENDIGFWVPMIARGPDGRERHVLFTPWLWVDSPVAMTGGREVYGFAKELGVLRMPDRAGGEFSVDAPTLERFGPTQEVAQRRVLSVRPNPGGVMPRLRELLLGGGQILRGLDHFLAPGVPASYVAAARSVLAQREQRMVFLKQFPDAHDASRACYQAVIEAPITITSDVRGRLLPGSFRVELASHVSHPIVDTLGLHPTRRTLQSTELSSRLGLWVGFEARVERGEIVYDAVAARTREHGVDEMRSA
jgi:uncharacterized protein with NAD-binding domain and iron-sulfur cluster